MPVRAFVSAFRRHYKPKQYQMQKDLKIGLILGLAIVSAAGLWLATRPSLTPQARLLDTSSAGAQAMDEGRRTRDESGRRSPPARRRSPEAREPVRRAVVENTVKSKRLAGPAVNVQPEAIKPQRFHIVRKGETLSEISYDYYGSAGKWRKIFEANRDKVKDANVVRAGTKLMIPD